MFTINEILDIAVRIEKNGEEVYRNAVDNITDTDLISLLEWMAGEEVDHAKWFFDLNQEIKTTSKNPFMEEISQDLLKEMIGDQSFSLKEVDFSSVVQVQDLVAIFIEFEEDSILFYEMLKMITQNEGTLAEIDRIIAEEKQHIEKLMAFIDQ